MADARSRLTRGRRPGVFAMQFGPGAENAFPGIASAYADNVPLLVIPTCYDTERQQVRPHLRSAAVFESVTKAQFRVDSAHGLRDAMRRALAALRVGPPGPVLLEVPHHLALAPVDAPAAPAPQVLATPTRPDADAVTSAATLLRAATRPVVLAGQGVLYAGASAGLLTLAEQLAIPVATTLAGKSAFPERHPLSLGTAAAASAGPAISHLEDADLILALGTSLTRHVMTRTLPPDSRIIHVTLDHRDLYKDYEPILPVLGDAGLFLEDLDTALEGVQAAPAVVAARRRKVHDERTAWLDRWRTELTSDETPINPYRVVAELDRLAEELPSSVITHDSGSPRDQMVPFFRSAEPGSYIGWGKSHALGSGLGLTMGAKLTRPQATCLNLMGDAAFGMVGLDFETAVRNDIPIISVVNGNGIMACEDQAMRVAHERHGSRTIGGKYADIARAMGGIGLRVDQPGQLAGALRRAVEATRDGNAVLLEVITRPQSTDFSHRALFE